MLASSPKKKKKERKKEKKRKERKKESKLLAFGGERGWNCLIVWSIGLMNLSHGLSNI